MKNMGDFLIPFIGLKTGKHLFEYQISKTFFKEFDFDEFENCTINVEIVLEKKSTFLELYFKHKGTINIPCDLTGEPFDLPIKGKLSLLVKFGDEFNNENEELLVLPHGEHQIDTSQYVYEMIVLSIPSKRIHPGVKDGTLKSEALDILKELQSNNNKEKKEENLDPRWDQLKKLLNG